MLFPRSSLLAFAISLVANVPLPAAIVVDFDELMLGPSSASGSYFDGYGAGASAGSWSSQGATFFTNPFGPGWSYSNVNNATTAGFTNQYAALPGTGFGGSGNYALATGFFPNDVFFNLPANQAVESLRVSNSTYAALSMRDGDMFAKQFGGPTGNDPDFFKVTFTGFSNADGMGAATGSTEFFLADYRFSNNALDYIVSDWRLVNLAPLGHALSVGLTFDGSDRGDFGLNTPTYIAIDQIAMTSAPEPSSWVLLSIAAASGFLARKRSGRIS